MTKTGIPFHGTLSWILMLSASLSQTHSHDQASCCPRRLQFRAPVDEARLELHGLIGLDLAPCMVRQPRKVYRRHLSVVFRPAFGHALN